VAIYGENLRKVFGLHVSGKNAGLGTSLPTLGTDANPGNERIEKVAARKLLSHISNAILAQWSLQARGST